MSKVMHKSIKPVGTRPSTMHGLCKVHQEYSWVHKQEADSCPLFRPILSALQTPIYDLAKFLIPILDNLTKN